MDSFLINLMTSHGYLVFILLAFVQAACIPISSEVTFAFAGVIAATQPNKFSLVAVILIGIAAEMGGSLTSYAVGRRGGRPLLERYGKFVLVSRSDLDRAERFFAGRGAWAVAVGRMLPVIRCFMSFAAGVVEVPALAFTIFSFIGTAIFTTALTLVGYSLGDTALKLFHKFTLVSIVIVALFLIALIAHRVHALMKERHDDYDQQYDERYDERPNPGRSPRPAPQPAPAKPTSHRARR